jgi:hypothetical protein
MREVTPDETGAHVKRSTGHSHINACHSSPVMTPPKAKSSFFMDLNLTHSSRLRKLYSPTRVTFFSRLVSPRDQLQNPG